MYIGAYTTSAREHLTQLPPQGSAYGDRVSSSVFTTLLGTTDAFIFNALLFIYHTGNRSTDVVYMYTTTYRNPRKWIFFSLPTTQTSFLKNYMQQQKRLP